MPVKVYNPKDVVIILGSIIVTGFADATFLSVDFNEDSFTLQVGVDGEGTRSKSNNRSATATFTTMQSSDANDLLSALHALDINSGGGDGIVPMLIKDLQGTSLYAAETAWIRKQPTSEFAREAGPREWVIETDDLDALVGSN
jgi:hypothetical protein